MTFEAIAETRTNPNTPPMTLGSISPNGDAFGPSPTPGAGVRPDGGAGTSAGAFRDALSTALCPF